MLRCILTLVGVVLATAVFCYQLDSAVKVELQQPIRTATLYYSDIEYVSHSAHAPRRHRPAEVKP